MNIKPYGTPRLQSRAFKTSFRLARARSIMLIIQWTSQIILKRKPRQTENTGLTREVNQFWQLFFSFVNNQLSIVSSIILITLGKLLYTKEGLSSKENKFRFSWTISHWIGYGSVGAVNTLLPLVLWQCFCCVGLCYFWSLWLVRAK